MDRKKDLNKINIKNKKVNRDCVKRLTNQNYDVQAFVTKNNEMVIKSVCNIDKIWDKYSSFPKELRTALHIAKSAYIISQLSDVKSIDYSISKSSQAQNKINQYFNENRHSAYSLINAIKDSFYSDNEQFRFKLAVMCLFEDKSISYCRNKNKHDNRPQIAYEKFIAIMHRCAYRVKDVIKKETERKKIKKNIYNFMNKNKSR